MKNKKRNYTDNGNGTLQLSHGPVVTKESYKNMIDYRTTYVKNFYRQFNIKLSKARYKDVVAWMEQQDNLARYIAELVRNDMNQATERPSHEQ